MLAHLREVRLNTFIDLGHFNPLAEWGGLGVDLFFCLSGYVIGHAYYDRFVGQLHSGDYLKFLCYRLGRLYPIHIVTMLVMLVFFTAAQRLSVLPTDAGHFGTETILANVFLVQAWWAVLGSPNGPAWTISAEWLAYLVFPLLVLGASRLSRLAKLGAYIALMAAVFFVPDWSNARATTLWPIPALQILVEFGVGLLLFLLQREYSLSSKLPRALGLIAAVGFIIALYVSSQPGPWIFLAFSGIVLALSNERDWFRGGVTNRVTLYLGEISYSIYMVHWLVWTPWKYGFGVVFHNVNIMTPWFMLPPAIISICAAAVMFHVIELPARALIRHWTNTRLPSAASVT